jgi:hypothetical protein
MASRAVRCSLILSGYAGLTLVAAVHASPQRSTTRHPCTSVLAMLSILAFAALAAAVPDCIPRSAPTRGRRSGRGSSLLSGVFVSAITGMIYKIVPFLNWLHLQRLGAPLTAVPNMRKMIPADAMTGQLRLHILLATALLLAAVWQPGTGTRLAGAIFAASCAWLGWNLAAAVRRYQAFRDQIRAAALTLLTVICLPLTADQIRSPRGREISAKGSRA